MMIKHIFETIESCISRSFLATFATLLFTQIISHEIFGRSISWIGELSTYMFV